MPKMKTNKSLAKRLKVTGTGRLIRRRPGAGHLRSRKTPKRLRRFHRTAELPRQFRRSARRLLGLGLPR